MQGGLMNHPRHARTLTSKKNSNQMLHHSPWYCWAQLTVINVVVDVEFVTYSE